MIPVFSRRPAKGRESRPPTAVAAMRYIRFWLLPRCGQLSMSFREREVMLRVCKQPLWPLWYLCYFPFSFLIRVLLGAPFLCFFKSWFFSALWTHYLRDSLVVFTKQKRRKKSGEEM